MGTKKKSKKKAFTNSLALSEKEEEILANILENPGNLTPDNIRERITSNEMAVALVERLATVNAEAVDILFLIEDSFEDKQVRKAVKKTIFKLRQKGVTIPVRDNRHTSPVALIKQEENPPEAYVGSIDTEGGQSVLLVVPHIYKGYEIGIGVVNHNTGMEYFLYNECGKKRSGEIKKFFIDQNIRVVKTSVSHAAAILEKAYKMNEFKAGESASDYLKLRPWLQENSAILKEPVIYDFIDRQDIPAEDITESVIVELFEQELMDSWIIGSKEISPVIDDILKVNDSLILVTEGQKMDRVNEIKKKALSSLFPESKRLIVKHMLEETAYIFYKSGEENYAKMCLAAAMEAGDISSGKDLFLMSLLERSLAFYMDIENDSGQQSGIIDDAGPMVITP